MKDDSREYTSSVRHFWGLCTFSGDIFQNLLLTCFCTPAKWTERMVLLFRDTICLLADAAFPNFHQSEKHFLPPQETQNYPFFLADLKARAVETVKCQLNNMDDLHENLPGTQFKNFGKPRPALGGSSVVPKTCHTSLDFGSKAACMVLTLCRVSSHKHQESRA